MASLRLIFLTFLTMATGVAVAFGVASLIGLVWHPARIPVFLALSIWWLWVGWRYASAMDPARRSGITRNQALAIFHQQYLPHVVAWSQITETLPERCKPFHLQPFPDCWFILFSLGEPRLASSRLLAVSKRDGSIVYDGSANDEG